LPALAFACPFFLPDFRAFDRCCTNAPRVTGIQFGSLGDVLKLQWAGLVEESILFWPAGKKDVWPSIVELVFVFRSQFLDTNFRF